MIEGQPDRVSFSFGAKVSIAQYESADFHMTYSSDVKANETPAQAFKRVSKFVEEESEKKLDEVRSIAK